MNTFQEAMTQYTVATYISYLTISIGICIWVAKTLSKNGAVFLKDAFHGNEELAKSINHLLVVGFYLINIGYISLVLTFGSRPDQLIYAIESLSMRVGGVLLILGFMHFFNLFIFSMIRRRGLRLNNNSSVAERNPLTFPPATIPSHQT
ncbi:MAG: hypothetical protein H7A32_01990 [Deltaproteobacteria bacterium]|nr:hypothetical protein [Deltaproteobacteria bacterium]